MHDIQVVVFRTAIRGRFDLVILLDHQKVLRVCRGLDRQQCQYILRSIAALQL